MLSRRQVFLVVLSLSLSGLSISVGAEETQYPTIENIKDVNFAYISRTSGRVVGVKSFLDVNPEITQGETVSIAFRPPVQNVYVGHAPLVFKQDIKRYGFVDLEQRNTGLGFFSTLRDSYTPQEFTHHFLLNLAERGLLRADLQTWVQAQITDEQRESALDFFHRVHKGVSGLYITDNPQKRDEAIRFYEAREVLRPVLYMGKTPIVGGVKIIGQAAHDISVAARGVTEGFSALGAYVGGTAFIGTDAGGISSAKDGGSGTGGGLRDPSEGTYWMQLDSN